MSRPFSYNDENFTVIGNVLFLHIRLTKKISSNDNIIEIPPEIYKHMLYKSLNLVIVTPEDNNQSIRTIPVGTRKSLSDEKYYLYTSTAFDNIGNYLIGYFILKDI